jgi:methyl-accepting chemotaxis protein
VLHAVAESAIVAVLAAGASVHWLSPRTRSVVATLGLVTSSAILVHLSGGVIEMHFHCFVVVAMVALYQSWVPFLVALAYVALHHGTIGALDPPRCSTTRPRCGGRGSGRSSTAVSSWRRARPAWPHGG